MALAQIGKSLGKVFKHSNKEKNTDAPKRQEEEEKLRRMRKMKGSVRVRSPT